MICDFRKPGTPLGRTIDLDTGQVIPWVFWLNDYDGPEGHSYRQYVTDERGRLLFDADSARPRERHVTGARIRFEPCDPPRYQGSLPGEKA